MKRVFLIGLPLLLISAYIRGQSITPSMYNSAGGATKIGTNTYEWSVGEMTLVHTATSSNIIVTQGLLQPMPRNTTAIQTPIALYENLQVYPNPTSGIVYLQYNLPATGNMKYSLLDVTGKLIQNNQVAVERTGKLSIDMGSIANATYMLYVYYQPISGASQTASYKVNKIN
ncbi:MAG: T9SS type A sorting domain-containing protein [Sphingobacteriales bacterium]|nr:MAG: T9SS type A sorting domain-containing protein [Sphingobacteriales bacterium]